RDLVFVEELLAVVADVGADHLRVGAGHQGRGAGGGAVGGDPVAARAAVRLDPRAGAQLGDRGVVALDGAVEAPLLLEHVGLGVLVRTPGNAVYRVEGAHDRVGSRVDGGLERRQVHVAQPGLGHVGGVVVPATLGLAVGDVVLHARDDLVRCAVVGA